MVCRILLESVDFPLCRQKITELFRQERLACLPVHGWCHQIGHSTQPRTGMNFTALIQRSANILTYRRIQSMSTLVIGLPVCYRKIPSNWKNHSKESSRKNHASEANLNPQKWGLNWRTVLYGVCIKQKLNSRILLSLALWTFRRIFLYPL